MFSLTLLIKVEKSTACRKLLEEHYPEDGCIMKDVFDFLSNWPKSKTWRPSQLKLAEDFDCCKHSKRFLVFLLVVRPPIATCVIFPKPDSEYTASFFYLLYEVLIPMGSGFSWYAWGTLRLPQQARASVTCTARDEPLSSSAWISNQWGSGLERRMASTMLPQRGFMTLAPESFPRRS